MAILSEEQKLFSGHREWKMVKLMNDASTDETTSDAVEIQNATSVTLLVETSTGVSSGVVKLEVGAVSTGPFYVAGTVTTNAASAAFCDTIAEGEAGLPAKYARARIETVIGGGTVDVYLIIQK